MDASNVTMDASEMNSTFYSSTTTALWSLGWVPSTTSGYAGTCVFLVFFTILFRCLFALKQLMERRLGKANSQSRSIGGAYGEPIFKRLESDPDLKSGILVINGVEETVRIVTQAVRVPATFRFSHDILRAALYTVTVGVGYLLMLAVMTLNIGYFLSILGGSFLGDLAVRRYITYDINNED